MAFKKSTVNAAKVPSTLTDYISYIDISRAGITTLAQAQSARIYADEAKLVEQPREIVSAAEAHTKIASFSGTTDQYIDYDGIRSDYATTATYGAESVWSDYRFAWHGSSAINSADSQTLQTRGSITVGGATGQVGDATEFDGVDDTLYLNDTSLVAPGEDDFTIQSWVNPDTTSFYPYFVAGQRVGNGEAWSLDLHSDGTYGFLIQEGSSGFKFVQASSYSTGVWSMVHTTFDRDSNGTLYVGGSSVGATSISAESASLNPPYGLNIGSRRNASPTNFISFFDGLLQGARMKIGLLSDDWITTEYNNQSDESSFWGDWADVGGGAPEPDYTLTAETGAFALSGQTADFFTQYALAASSGALTLVGEAANIAATRLLSTSPGAFAVDGSDADLLAQYTVSGAHAAFAVAGSGADILASYLLTGTAAAYNLSGSQASLLRQLRLPCSAGAFLLEGNSADFYRQLRLACVPGSFVVSGNAVSLLASYRLSAVAGAYTLEGQKASLSVGYKVTAQTAGFTVSGPAAAILARYAMPLATGAFTMVGNDATIDVVAYIQPFCPMDSPFEDAASAFEGSFSSFTPFSEGECE